MAERSLRVPPQNLEAEKAVLGSILIDNDSLGKIIDIVSAESFYDPRHALLFEHILHLYGENKPIDALTLTAQLKKNKKLRQSGGAVYLSELIAQVPTASNIANYANLVREAFVRRKLISLGAKLDEEARKEDKELDIILDEVEGDLLNVALNTTERDFFDTTSLIELQMKRADEFAKNPNALRGLPSGFRDMDKILGGFHKSDLIILAARPSVGKSAFAISLARHIAVDNSKTVAIFNLEMPAIQVFERMMANQMGINLWNIRMGKMTDAEYARYAEGAGKLSEAKIFIDETPGLGIMQIRSKARKLKLENDLDFLVIDYLQLMQGRNIDNRAQEVGEISRSLKILARELDIPILALSQLNRAVENRADRTPQLSDLRESGSIEQDADLVMFLSRDMQVEEELDSIVVDVHVAKHRNGAIGKFSLVFKGAQQKYFDMDT